MKEQPQHSRGLHAPASAFDGEALTLRVTVLPRFARRLRLLAHEAGRPLEHTASRLLATALIPDKRERVRLAAAALREARGES